MVSSGVDFRNVFVRVSICVGKAQCGGACEFPKKQPMNFHHNQISIPLFPHFFCLENESLDISKFTFISLNKCKSCFMDLLEILYPFPYILSELQLCLQRSVRLFQIGVLNFLYFNTNTSLKHSLHDACASTKSWTPRSPSFRHYTFCRQWMFLRTTQTRRVFQSTVSSTSRVGFTKLLADPPAVRAYVTFLLAVVRVY